MEFLFCLLFISVFLVTLVLLPYAGLSLRKFSIPSFFIIFYLARDFFGILPLYFGYDDYGISLGATDKDIIFRMLIFSSISLILIVCGFIYANSILGLNGTLANINNPVNTNTVRRILVFILAITCGLVLAWYITKVDSVALFRIFEGDIVGASVSRSNMGNNFQGKFWLYKLFFRYLLDYTLIFFMFDFLVTRKIRTGLIFAGIFVVAAFSATMAIEKGPFTKIIIILYLTYITYKGGNYWQPVTKYFLIFVIAALAVFYINFMGAGEVGHALYNISRRIVIGQITPLYFYLDLFPNHVEYLWGTSFPNPSGILPFEQYNLTVEVSNVIWQGVVSEDIVGTSPTVFWAEMYANFGVPGIIISSFFVGTGIFIVSHFFTRVEFSPVIVAAVISLTMHYRELTGTSLSSYFIDTKLFIFVSITFTILMIGKKFKPDYSLSNSK